MEPGRFSALRSAFSPSSDPSRGTKMLENISALLSVHPSTLAHGIDDDDTGLGQYIDHPWQHSSGSRAVQKMI